ncbi:MAG: hypothetical protein ACRDMK_04300 [Gaiellaceae bacterium]
MPRLPSKRQLVSARVRGVALDHGIEPRVPSSTRGISSRENGFPRKRFRAMMSGLDIHYDLGEGHPLLGRRMLDLDLVTANGPAVGKRSAEMMSTARTEP